MLILYQKFALIFVFKNFISYTEHFVRMRKISAKATKNILYNIFDKGYSVMDILDNYFLFVKVTTICFPKKAKNIRSIQPYLCKYITIFHNIHEDEIELALFTNNFIQLFS